MIEGLKLAPEGITKDPVSKDTKQIKTESTKEKTFANHMCERVTTRRIHKELKLLKNKETTQF